MDNDFGLLKELCEMPGVSGFEEPAQAIAERELKKYCSEVWRDRMGNVFGLKKGTSGGANHRKVMFAGHMDEIGMMVTFIDDDGFVRFTNVGGLSSEYLISQRVIIHGTEPVAGVIPTIYAGLVGEEAKNKVPPLENLYIDTGLPAKEVKAKVNIGDIISIDQDFKVLNGKVVTGRNFDDRLGVYCMLLAMKNLGKTQADVYAVSTVQEELGVRGAYPAAYTVGPDYAIAIDGAITWDVPYAPPHQKRCHLGQGTGIYMIDRLTLGSPRLIKFLIALCEKNKIPFQRNIGGGTDASAIQRAKGGSLCTTIGAPTRYMHSSVQLAHADDLWATGMLLKVFAEEAHRLDD